jgi:lysyl-tRNA synthetase class II
MASIEELKSARLKKLEILKNSGIDPYPSRVPRDFDVSYVRTNFSDLEVSQNLNR